MEPANYTMTPTTKTQNAKCWNEYRYTLGLCAVMAVANAGLFANAGLLEQLIDWLQFDRQAVLDGQIWRVATGNLVHWSREHFLLDVGAFALVGMLYESRLGRAYPWVLLGSALAVGLGVLLFLPEMQTYRGLSGVDSGQFAAVLAVECRAAVGNPRRWLWLAPVTGIFVAKIVFESASGQMFFGTESLGDIGLPTPLAHAAGALAGGGAMLVAYCLRTLNGKRESPASTSAENHRGFTWPNLVVRESPARARQFAPPAACDVRRRRAC